MQFRTILPFAALLPAVLTLNCSGPIEIAVAVPGSERISQTQFEFIEDFLHGIVSYFTGAQFSFILYGKDPVVISGLSDASTLQAVNARATLLSQRQLFKKDINGGQNVPKAIEAVSDALKSGRNGVPKVGIVMTYGAADLTSDDGMTVAQDVAEAASDALSDGVQLFAISTNGTVPGFENITQDRCRLFSLGNYDSLSNSLLPYLASSVCYVLDDSVNPSLGNCFPVVKAATALPKYQCTGGDIYKFLADPYNCAYYYRCPFPRKKCSAGTWFDPNINRCNHYQSTSCYNNLACPAKVGTFPYPGDCSKYLSCYNWAPRTMDCQKGLVFNPNKNYCDFTSNYHCVDK